jgi:predicted RNA binding protein YcfA (HicA-like mRNA interferase family)
LGTKPTLTLKDIRKKLKKLGFTLQRRKKHEIWDNGRGQIIPLSKGNQDVGKTLLKSICHELGMTVDDFLKI